ncbi:MAG: OadG family protein [Oscillospiraceae bacterium]
MSYLDLALQLMGYGLSSVFLVLILFIIMIVLLTKLFPGKDAEKK